MSSSLESTAASQVGDVMHVCAGDDGYIGAVTCDTIPPKGAGETFPVGAGLTGDLLVARYTFLGSDDGASIVWVIAKMAMI
jgi:hypothetical protein